MGAISILLAVLVQDGTLQQGRAPHRSLSLLGAGEEQKALLETFSISGTDFPWKLQELRSTDRFTQYRLSFPSPVETAVEENNTVVALYWVPRGTAPRRPAAIVLHWLGGTFDALPVICERLAERGIAPMMLYMPHYGPRRAADRERREKMVSPDAERTVASMRQAVLDIRCAGDWLASRPDIDPSRIGLFGISLGAVIGSVAAGVDTRLKPACFMIGGGDLPGILLSGHRELEDVKRRFQESGQTREKLAETLRAVEPLTWASRVDGSTTLLINAESDEVIPRACTDRLAEAMGRPRQLWFKAGHYTIVAHLGKILDEVASHFNPVAPAIRVLVAEERPDVEVDIAGPFDVLRPGTLRPLAAKIQLAPFRATVKDGIVLGDRAFQESHLILRSPGRYKLGGRAAEGTLHLVVSRTGKLNAILELDLERYVAGVVGPEIGPEAPREAMKAQAVCARTYAWMRRAEAARATPAPIFDVFNDTRSQVYSGPPEAGSPAERAVAETAGMFLTFQGAPFTAFYHSTCGGTTADGAEVFGVDVAPLKGVACGECDHSPTHSWTLSITPDEWATLLKAKPGGGTPGDIVVSAKTRSGRASEISLSSADGTTVRVSAAELQDAVGHDRLRSTSFTVVRSDGTLLFSGRGSGHGVGMCQEGALGMARRGRSWQEILAKYYPSSTLRKLY